MIKVSVWCHDLSDSYLRQVTQLGAECIDFGGGDAFSDLDSVLAAQKRLRRWGLEINRVTLPDLTGTFMNDQPGAEQELDVACKALEMFGRAGVLLARQRFAGDIMPSSTPTYQAVHRGGYRSRGEMAHLSQWPSPSRDEIERWWSRFCLAFERLVPVAEAHGIKLAVHPSDAPYPGTPLGALGFHRVLDAFPSSQVGLLYCVGTRAEAGGSALVLDEINHYGRKGRIFGVHLRNVRGSLATSGGFEEVLLDDGDMNMFRIVQELRKVSFDGCLNPDHVPTLEGDAGYASHGLAYSVGYIKALLAALAA